MPTVQDPQRKENNNTSDSPLKPDPETLHTTDPQENMEGPISSIVQSIKEGAEANNAETKEEADRKKEENM